MIVVKGTSRENFGKFIFHLNNWNYTDEPLYKWIASVSIFFICYFMIFVQLKFYWLSCFNIQNWSFQAPQELFGSNSCSELLYFRDPLIQNYFYIIKIIFWSQASSVPFISKHISITKLYFSCLVHKRIFKTDIGR